MELSVRTIRENDMAQLDGIFDECLCTLSFDEVLRKQLLDETFPFCKQKPDSAFIVEANKKTVGIACVERSLWDSEHFGVEIGRIKVMAFKVLPFSEAKRARMRVIGELIAYCKNYGIKCIMCRIDVNDIMSVQILESRGFSLMDILVSFKTDLGDIAHHGEAKNLTPIYIRPLEESDTALLMEVARKSFSQDHFHSDPHFSKEKSDELYAKWIENCCKGSVDAVLVAEKKGKIAGFITCRVKKTYDSGVIDLMSVHPRFQRLGIGTQLLLKALDWFKERVKVVYVGTQITNTAAIGMYQRAGFKYLRSEITLHKWI